MNILANGLSRLWLKLEEKRAFIFWSRSNKAYWADKFIKCIQTILWGKPPFQNIASEP